MNRSFIIIVVIAGILLAVGYYFNSSSSTKMAQDQYSQSPDSSVTEAPTPKMSIDKTKTYTAVLKTTEGDITIELNASQTPITVNNFVTLAEKGFYNNTIFHRIINGFMIQGGDPTGTGRGGPGYKFDDEPFKGEYVKGTVAMANAGPNTNGSQFFIMHEDKPLPKDYVIFGTVMSGIAVVDKIATAPTKSDPYSGENSVPVNPVRITTVEIKES